MASARLAAAIPRLRQNARAAAFLELIQPQLAATEERFQEYLGSDVPFLQDAGEYIFGGGGKRIRPALLLLCARLLGHRGEEVITYAAAVELIHTATLIHDDVIDHAGTRRGRAAVHAVWDNSRTVLLGDWLYTTAMRESLRHGNVAIIRLLCEATQRMTEGELLALDRLGAPDLSVDEYHSILERKTAWLFAASCSLPALIEPARPEEGEALRRYGHALGFCFQLVDDLLDYTGQEAEVGKPLLADAREGKLTLPLLLALPQAEAAERELVREVLAGRQDAEALEGLLALVDRLDTVEACRRAAEEHAAAARRALESFPDSVERRALEAAPDLILRRRA